ncbi:hypothetical protein BNJ_00303 [Kaumoebavirus]|uniref:hypothetical protein n=1 Tax=Kaumoebavirus TaxID=1859492 RepID=UPI0009C22D36|nr:hypothetical protein BNJ_00303 [Kaumoebavirus]ARA72125.1 hypothetical protein BNJ_00303 [Kaumoebavirus]
MDAELHKTHPYTIDTFGRDGQYLETQHLKRVNLTVEVTDQRTQEMQYLYDILADPRIMPWSFPQGKHATFSFQTGEATINGVPIDVNANLMTPHYRLRESSILVYSYLRSKGLEFTPEVGATDSDNVGFIVGKQHFFVAFGIDGKVCYGYYEGPISMAWDDLDTALEEFSKKL